MRILVSLFLLMGISWSAEVISVLTNGSFEQWVVVDCFNILMGVFIFIILVCKSEVWEMLKVKFPCLAIKIPTWKRSIMFPCFSKDRNESSSPVEEYCATTMKYNTSNTSLTGLSNEWSLQRRPKENYLPQHIQQSASQNCCESMTRDL